MHHHPQNQERQPRLSPSCRQPANPSRGVRALFDGSRSRAGIASSVQRSLCAVRPALRSSPLWNQASDVVNLRRFAIRELLVPFRVRRETDRRWSLRSPGSSPGVWSPSATSILEARSPRGCLPRHLPTSGFCTLLPACFFQNLPALFHAGAARGVFPPGLFPLTEPLSPFGNSDLPGVGARLSRSDGLPRRASLTESVAFKALLSARIRHLRKWGEPLAARPLPSWSFRPLGGSPLRRPDACAPDPLMSFAIVPDPSV